MNVVRGFDFMRSVVHDNNVFFIINCKYSDGIACVIGNGNMTVVREDHQIFGIIAADRKRELLFQKTCFRINLCLLYTSTV